MAQLVPVNISAPAAMELARSTGADAASLGAAPTAPSADTLCNWTQENRSLSVHAAANLGFPVGDVDVSGDRQILIFGSSKWADVQSGAHSYRFGVSIRVVVQASDLKTKGSLTLPLVAADVEANGARASAELIVRGFKGSLGAQLPKWQSFGVEQYSQYMEAVSRIQETVMGASEDLIAPQLLATTAVASALPESDRILAVIHATTAIARGECLNDALREQPDQAAEFIRGVYVDAGIPDEVTPPSQGQRHDAIERMKAWGVQGGHLAGWHW